MPIVLLDSDSSGKKMAEALKKDLYQNCPDSILLVSNFSKLPQAEIEDLIPSTIMIKTARCFTTCG